MRDLYAKAFIALLVLTMAAVPSASQATVDPLLFALKLGDDLPLIELDEGNRIIILLVSDEGTKCIAKPEGARWAEESNRLEWIPDFNQKGVHSIVFIGSIDGQEEESFVTMSVHDTEWIPDTSQAVAAPAFLGPPYGRLVPVKVDILDPLGNSVPVFIGDVLIEDTFLHERTEVFRQEGKGSFDAFIKHVAISFTTKVAKAKQGEEYRLSDGSLQLRAYKPGISVERVYIVHFVACHQKTGLSAAGIVRIPVI